MTPPTTTDSVCRAQRRSRVPPAERAGRTVCHRKPRPRGHAKQELAEVILEIIRTDCPLMRAQQPTIEQGGSPDAPVTADVPHPPAGVFAPAGREHNRSACDRLEDCRSAPACRTSVSLNIFLPAHLGRSSRRANDLRFSRPVVINRYWEGHENTSRQGNNSRYSTSKMK